MLIIRRNPGETVRIGDATVTVCAVAGRRVELGIVAPRDVPIERIERDPEPKEAPERVDE